MHGLPQWLRSRISPPRTIPEFSFQTKQLFDVIQQWPAVRGASEQYRRYVQKLR